MSIYTRDNVNYQSMIDAMLRNKTQQAQREADRIERIGKLDADTAKGIASTIGKGLDYYQAYKEDKSLEDQLKELEDRRDTLRAQYTTNQDYKPYSTTDEYKAAMNMKNYIDTDSPMHKWLSAHPGMTEADYEQFIEYMNALYGGR